MVTATHIRQENPICWIVCSYWCCWRKHHQTCGKQIYLWQGMAYIHLPTLIASTRKTNPFNNFVSLGSKITLFQVDFVNYFWSLSAGCRHCSNGTHPGLARLQLVQTQNLLESLLNQFTVCWLPHIFRSLAVARHFFVALYTINVPGEEERKLVHLIL